MEAEILAFDGSQLLGPGIHESFYGMAILRAALIDNARKRHAGEAHLRFGALDASPEPVKIVGHAAGQILAAAIERHRLSRTREQRYLADRIFRQYPGVLISSTALQRDHQRIPALRNARESSLHHRIGVAIRREVRTDHEPARLQLTLDE